MPSKVSIGFGFDSKRNDCKVLRISMEDLDRCIEVELHSLRKNSWKQLAPPKYDLYSNDVMVFINGIVHWIAFERVKDRGRQHKFLLLGFDMSNERYTYIWVMKEYDGVNTWNKLFSYTESLVLLEQGNDTRSENDAKNASNARSSIEEATDSFSEYAADDEAIDDSKDDSYTSECSL
ncbi:hypothetical protein REPUB_Repub05bG0055800 [Reevesia pubescens]